MDEFETFLYNFISGVVAEMTVTIEITNDSMVHWMRGCFGDIVNVSEEMEEHLDDSSWTNVSTVITRWVFNCSVMEGMNPASWSGTDIIWGDDNMFWVSGSWMYKYGTITSHYPLGTMDGGGIVVTLGFLFHVGILSTLDPSNEDWIVLFTGALVSTKIMKPGFVSLEK